MPRGISSPLDAVVERITTGASWPWKRSDNEPEFIAIAAREWLSRIGVKMLDIEPGSPWENGYNASFNGKPCDELLSGEIFSMLKEAKILIEAWCRHCNTVMHSQCFGIQAARARGLPYSPHLASFERRR